MSTLTPPDLGQNDPDDELLGLHSGFLHDIATRGIGEPASLLAAADLIGHVARHVLAIQSALGAICITLELLDEQPTRRELSKALRDCARLAASALSADAEPVTAVPTATVRCQRLEVVDDAGNVRAFIGHDLHQADGHLPAFFRFGMLSESGTNMAMIAVADDGERSMFQLGTNGVGHISADVYGPEDICGNTERSVFTVAGRSLSDPHFRVHSEAPRERPGRVTIHGVP